VYSIPFIRQKIQDRKRKIPAVISPKRKSAPQRFMLHGAGGSYHSFAAAMASYSAWVITPSFSRFESSPPNPARRAYETLKAER